MPEACAIPIELTDDECVVRAIKTPYHVKDGKPYWRALKPSAGKSIISIIRQCMGDNFCKDKSKSIDPKSYLGLLATRAVSYRSKECLVFDHRKDFCGHAHVDHQIVMPDKGVPLAPAVSEALKIRCEEILKASQWHQDPSPEVAGWGGTALTHGI